MSVAVARALCLLAGPEPVACAPGFLAGGWRSQKAPSASEGMSVAVARALCCWRA